MCLKTDGEKVPDSTYFVRIWPTFSPKLTALLMSKELPYYWCVRCDKLPPNGTNTGFASENILKNID